MTTPLLNLKYFFFPKCIKLQVNTPSEGWVAASSGWEEDVQGKEAHGDPEEYMGYGVRSLLFHQLQVPLLHLPYEGLSLSKFLYSLCKKHIRFALATTALPTGGPLSKQTSKEIFLWLRLFHYRKKKQTDTHTKKKKRQHKRTAAFPVVESPVPSIRHNSNVCWMAERWNWQHTAYTDTGQLLI